MNAAPTSSASAVSAAFLGVGRARAVILAGILAALFAMAWRIADTSWLCDDAFISFRYVWHAVNGHGLVFNVGDRVEGYTNFLWVLELAAIQRVFGVVPETACHFLSITYTALSLVCVFALASTGSNPSRRAVVALGALVLLATSHTWIVWSTSGLETRQFTFFGLLGIVLVTRASGRVRVLIAASLAFGCAELTRPEGTLFFGCAFGWLVLEQLIARRLALRDVCAFVLPFVFVVAAHYLWRHAYYGDWLPNTYYAKHVRAWPEAGFRYIGAAGIEMGAWFTLPFAIVGCVWRARRGDRTHVLSLVTIAAYAAYLIQIGGDFFEWRPLDFTWPLLAVAACEGIGCVADVVAENKALLRRAIATILFALAVVYGAAVQEAKLAVIAYDPPGMRNPDPVRTLDRERVPALYAIPPLNWLTPAYDDLQAYTLKRRVGSGWHEHVDGWKRLMEKWGPFMTARDREPLPRDAVAAQAALGIVSYALADLFVVDMHGLVDRELARQPVDKPNDQRLMAHDRLMSKSDIEGRGWNFQPFPARKSRGEALTFAPYAVRFSDDVWLPFASPKPDWVERAFVDRATWTVDFAFGVGCFDDPETPPWTTNGAAFERGIVHDMPFTRAFPWPLPCGAAAGMSSRGSAGGVGTATSRAFRIPLDASLEARLCGTIDGSVGLRVRAASNGEILASTIAPDPDWPLPIHLDLARFADREVVVELFDESAAGWVAASSVVVLTVRELRAK